MDFRRFEYFVKVAEKLSFSEAARELFVSPQALSQQIALLEQELGARLFVRDTRRIELTAAGQTCLALIRPVKTAYDQALLDIRSAIAGQRGKIRAGFFNILPKNEMVTPWLEFLQRACGIDQLELVSGDMKFLENSLRDGSLDICLTNIYDFTQLPDFDYEILLTVPTQIVVSQLHPWAGKSAITREDMAEADMLQMKQTSPASSDSFYSRVRCRSVRMVPDLDAMLVTLESGRFFAVFPPVFDYRDRANYLYFNLPAEDSFQAYTICACHKHHSSMLARDLVRRSHEALHLDQARQ